MSDETLKDISPYWAMKASEFHERNPDVYERLKEMALKVRQRREKYTMMVLYNVLRWKHDLETDDDTPFKLNENYKSWYARKLMAEVPQLEGFFNLRNSQKGE